MTRIKDPALAAEGEAELGWLRRHVPLTTRIAGELARTDFADRVICLNVHLDIKMVPVVEALLAVGARVLVIGCNPQTTRDSVAALMARAGAEVQAWTGMSEDERAGTWRWALDQHPEFTSEMGADVLVAAAGGRPGAFARMRAGMEATGTGIARLRGLRLPVPVFNWDGLALKQNLHNRHLVGLMVWNTFINVTHLTLFDRVVLIAGYGLVGQGLADHARRLGARVLVADLDPVRRHLARHHACEVVPLLEALPRADVVITATGRDGVIGDRESTRLRDGCILANAGHSNLEIDVPALRRHPAREVRRAVEEIDLGGRRVYLLAGGAMLNLAAGPGDPYDAFDLTSALMLAGIEWMVRRHAGFAAGIHAMPAEVEQRIAALADRVRGGMQPT